MTDLALSALTDVILACELFFLAGLSFRPGVERWSPAHLWALYLSLAGVGTMLGAIDHGFFEAIDHPGHAAMVIATRVVLAAGILTFVMATAVQFLSAPWRNVVAAAGLAAFAATVWVVSTSDDLLVIVGSNAIALLLMLVLSVRGLRTGTGSVTMCVGVVLTFAASLLVPFGGNGLPYLGLYATLHVAVMPAFLVLYLAGDSLHRARNHSLFA